MHGFYLVNGQDEMGGWERGRCRSCCAMREGGLLAHPGCLHNISALVQAVFIWSEELMLF